MTTGITCKGTFKVVDETDEFSCTKQSKLFEDDLTGEAKENEGSNR